MIKCEYCDRRFKSIQGLSSHKGKTHKDKILDEKVRIKSNYYDDILDITNRELLNKRDNHSNRCDICGKEETSNTTPKYKNSANNLCIDHNHTNKRFRGFLCVQCNRNFGWYEKYKDKIIEHDNFEHI